MGLLTCISRDVPADTHIFFTFIFAAETGSGTFSPVFSQGPGTDPGSILTPYFHTNDSFGGLRVIVASLPYIYEQQISVETDRRGVGFPHPVSSYNSYSISICTSIDGNI